MPTQPPSTSHIQHQRIVFLAWHIRGKLSYLGVVDGLRSPKVTRFLNLGKVAMLIIEARSIVEDCRHYSQANGSSERGGDSHQPDERRAMLLKDADSMKRRNHESQSDANSRQGHHPKYTGEMFIVQRPC